MHNLLKHWIKQQSKAKIRSKTQVYTKKLGIDRTNRQLVVVLLGLRTNSKIAPLILKQNHVGLSPCIPQGPVVQKQINTNPGLYF